jgi:hypothetical protein
MVIVLWAKIWLKWLPVYHLKGPHLILSQPVWSTLGRLTPHTHTVTMGFLACPLCELNRWSLCAIIYILCAFKYLLLDVSQFIGWILEGEITNARNSLVSKYIDVATIYYETDCTLWQGRSRFACWRTLDQETDLVHRLCTRSWSLTTLMKKCTMA